MLCNLCKKNPAVIYLEQPGSPRPRRLCLCESCAITRGIITKPQIPDQKKINDLMDELEREDRKNQEDQKVLCPVCSRSLYDLKSTHIVGCQYCYEAFSAEIEEMSGADIDSDVTVAVKTKRKKKVLVDDSEKDTIDTKESVTPKRRTRKQKVASPAKTLQGLQDALDKAVKLENYEEAAKLRDEINNMKESLSRGNDSNDILMALNDNDDDSPPF